MGGNKDNMRQAMKELLGLVGFGPEEEAAAQERGAAPAEQPRVAERPVAQERPKAPERPVAQPKIEREPAVERPKAPERPVAQEQPKIVREPAVERPKAPERPVVQEQPKAPERPVAQEKPPVVERPVEPEQPKVSYEEPKPAERGFFSFGGRRVKEKEHREPEYTAPVDPAYQPPAEPARPVYTQPVSDLTVEDGRIRPPFIRPGATVIAAGATFFGDIRAEGDVEVLGKVKGNLEATGNVRVLGKVLGDVKGEAVELQGCTVQGNITSTSFVTLDAGAMVVGDVLATDFESDGKVKGNLQIARAANFSSCALLAGNVIAATIVMAQGARVQGAVRIAEDPETNALFGELEI